MMEPKIIQDDTQYDRALEELEELILQDPDEGTEERGKIELLSLLIEDYENQSYQIPLPDPIEAIKFRMEQAGLRQRDLVHIIGSRSKVSEVLNRKRSLTLSMIRALHSSLGIPAEVLLQEEDPAHLEFADIDWDAFPLKEMVGRGWVHATDEEIEEDSPDVVRRFLEPLGDLQLAAALYRKTDNVRSARTMDRYALAAWTARVILRAREDSDEDGTTGEVDHQTMKELARLSLSKEGPRLAVEFLKALGISLIIEPHLSGTYLDGAAIFDDPEKPTIGMTIRHDRLDNFWFTLMHELAHVVLHRHMELGSFYDDLDFNDHEDPLEREADELAGEVLIPQDDWERSPASKLRSAEAADHLARQLGVHPAIVAGRIRHESNNYRILSQLVGYEEVRKHFPEVDWGN